MKKKLDELNKVGWDEKSPEAQAFLKNLQEEIIKLHGEFKIWMKENGIGKRNETK